MFTKLNAQILKLDPNPDPYMLQDEYQESSMDKYLMTAPEWEQITEEPYEATSRLKVEGGYLYSRVTLDSNDKQSQAMCFVPDVDLQRYQAHLRDAYKQGYQDGQEDAKQGIVNEEEGQTAYERKEILKAIL